MLELPRKSPSTHPSIRGWRLTYSVLQEVNNLLTTQSNPVTNIVQDLTQGTVTGLTNGAVFALKAIGATVPELDEKCACNMVFCNSAIIDAQGMCSESLLFATWEVLMTDIGDAAAGTSQACGQALYSCAAFYSAAQIASMTDGCCTPSNT
jgi:hypothetical protein